MKYSLILFAFCSILVYGQKRSKKIISSNDSSLAHISQHQGNDFDNRVLGLWCTSLKDHGAFSLSLMLKKDSVYCQYEYVKHNGSYLNAEAGNDDWAFVVPKRMFSDSYNGWIPAKNYRNIETDSVSVHVSIKYDKATQMLIWRLEETDDFNINSLPKFVRLKACPKK